jgi:hypothetical protein
MDMASEWLKYAPMTNLWVIGLIAMGITSAILHSQRYLTWHSYLFFAFGPLALIYLTYFGPHMSNLTLRTVTGAIFALGTVWFAYPYLEDSFNDIQQTVRAKLARISSIDTPMGRR